MEIKTLRHMRIKPKLWHPWPKPEPPHSSVLRSEKGYLKEYLLFRLLVIVQKKKQQCDTFRWQLGQTVYRNHNPKNSHRLELEVRSEQFQPHPPQGVSIILSTLLNSHTHSKHHTLFFFTHCGYLSPPHQSGHDSPPSLSRRLGLTLCIHYH